MRLMLVTILALILLSVTACETSIATGANPFCIVGAPPAELIPEAGAPHGWADDFLAVYDVTC